LLEEAQENSFGMRMGPSSGMGLESLSELREELGAAQNEALDDDPGSDPTDVVRIAVD
jgi:hypothetical protein